MATGRATGSASDVRATVQRALEGIDSGDLPSAEAAYRELQAAGADSTAAIHVRGLIALRRGDTRSATHWLGEAARRRPRDPRIALDFGYSCIAAGQLDVAGASLRRALADWSMEAPAHYGLGRIAALRGEHQQAITHYQRALARNPKNSRVCLDLGGAYHALRRFAEAEACARQALGLQPDSEIALTNLGAALQDQGKYAAATECYERALELRPANAVARLNRALIALVEGRLAEGFAEHHWRPQRRAPEAQQRLAGPERYLPGDLQGKSVLLLGEQGLGDELFFLRFAPILSAFGSELHFQGSEKIVSIVSRAGCLERAYRKEDPVPRTDYVMLVGDLPAATSGSMWSAPPPPLPLVALPEKVKAIQADLAGRRGGPYVGLVWRAGASSGQVRGESHATLVKEAPLDRIAAVLAGLDVTVMALQRHPRAGELALLERVLGNRLCDFCHLNDDLEGMLAALSLVDEYVGVSSTNNHLLAGLGKHAHVLVPFPPEWRWQASESESPWFTGSKVYRQAEDGDWNAAFAGLEPELARRFRS